MFEARRSLNAPSTLDTSARTVEVVALSGLAPVVRPAPAPDGTRTGWVEELSARGANLSRLAGGPVLRDHIPTTENAVGLVEEPRVVGDQILARVRFDGSPEAETIIAKVAAGSVRGLSLGYRVHEFTRAGVDPSGRPIFRATRWTPHELSFTPTPQDEGAVVRSKGAQMTTSTEPTAGNTTVVVDNPASATRAADIASIRGIAKAANLPDGWVLDRIADGASVEQARTLAFDEVTKRSAPAIDTRTRIVVGTDHGDPVAIRSAMAGALAAKLAPHLIKPEGRATEYMNYRALGMVGALAAARGERIDPFDNEALLTRAVGAHSTSDFPELLADTANRILLAQYQAVPPSYRSWCARKPFSDFREHAFVRRGDMPRHVELAENGGVKYGTLGENAETLKATEYVAGFSIGRRALVNDSLGALSDYSTGFATAAATDENSLAYGVLKSNGTLKDGKALFHADHSNLGTAAAISETSIAAARIAMSRQKTIDGRTMNVRGSILVVAPENYVAARKLVTAITPAKTEDINVFSGLFSIVEDAELSGAEWYIFADPNAFPTIVYGYVTGDGPRILTETDFDTQGIKVRSSFDFAVGPIDYRGAYRVPA